jgi:hypothetical protein
LIAVHSKQLSFSGMTMQRILFLACLMLSLSACSDKSAGPLEAKLVGDTSARSSAAKLLAYEHKIRVEVGEKKLQESFERVISTCRNASSESCDILESRIETGRFPSASLKFRAGAIGIQKLIAAIASQGEVIDQTTAAEDLSGPIADNEKKLAMLIDYRAKLEALGKRATADFDALVKINKELSQTQSEIEALNGSQAQLNKRVKTELLSVSIRERQFSDHWRPIREATSGFASSFSSGVASAITGAAYLLPWIAMLSLFGWGLRALWRKRKAR